MALPGSRALFLGGLGLFLFIPVVLYLLVAHPKPVGASLPVAIALFVLHRGLAARYFRAALDRKCLWCNRSLTLNASVPLALERGAKTAPEIVVTRCCAHHREPAARYLSFLDAGRWPLLIGVFLPLLTLVLALLASALGYSRWLPTVTATFQLVIGITVNVAANLYPWAQERHPPHVPFPLHNFSLLGLRNLLWIFRLVGLWWIFRSLTTLLPA